MNKNDLMNPFIYASTHVHQVAFLRRLLDMLETGCLSDDESTHWSKFVGDIDGSIRYLTALDGVGDEPRMSDELVNLTRIGNCSPSGEECNNS